ncbi:MAG: MEDS domain-containing protein, partial [Cyanobacteria bacterium]|nr:MEDS domain-containing protein [Cyanobacteriota bacterium]
MDIRVNNLKVHDHLCSVYQSSAELKLQCVPYLQAGLLLGEQCIYFVDESSPNFVMDAMRENEFIIDPYLESGA